MESTLTYDETKRATNLKQHGLDFADLTIDFFLEATTYPVKSGRSIAVNAFGAAVIAVVFKPLGTQGISVISMRPASKKERKAHGH